MFPLPGIYSIACPACRFGEGMCISERVLLAPAPFTGVFLFFVRRVLNVSHVSPCASPACVAERGGFCREVVP